MELQTTDKIGSCLINLYLPLNLYESLIKQNEIPNHNFVILFLDRGEVFVYTFIRWIKCRYFSPVRQFLIQNEGRTILIRRHLAGQKVLMLYRNFSNIYIILPRYLDLSYYHNLLPITLYYNEENQVSKHTLYSIV